MTFRKTMNLIGQLDEIDFRFGELRCLLKSAGFGEVSMMLTAIHMREIQPELDRLKLAILPQSFPHVFPEAVLESVPNNGIYKGASK